MKKKVKQVYIKAATCATKLLVFPISKPHSTARELQQPLLPWQRWHSHLWRSVDELPPLCQAQLACCHHEAYYWFWWHPHNVTSERSLTKLHRWQIADSPSYCCARRTILHLAEEGVQLALGVATIKHWHFLGSLCGALQRENHISVHLRHWLKAFMDDKYVSEQIYLVCIHFTADRLLHKYSYPEVFRRSCRDPQLICKNLTTSHIWSWGGIAKRSPATTILSSIAVAV